MSYEPSILLRKADLVRHQAEIEKYVYLDGVRAEIAAYLLKEMNQAWITLLGIEYLYMSPELSSFNDSVRKTLHSMDIEFWIHW